MFIDDKCFKQFMHYVIRAVYNWFDANRLFYIELRKPDDEYNHENVQNQIKRRARHANVIQAYALLMGIDRYDVIAMCKAGLKHGYTMQEVLEKFVKSRDEQIFREWLNRNSKINLVQVYKVK